VSREREASEVAGAARRMIRALGRRVGREDSVDLQLIIDLRAEVEAALTEAMRGQRALGFSYAEIGAGVGWSKQAVAQRLSAASRDDVA
jgi:DNA-directed RNA polymerase specialized sigma24 family protein